MEVKLGFIAENPYVPASKHFGTAIDKILAYMRKPDNKVSVKAGFQFRGYMKAYSQNQQTYEQTYQDLLQKYGKRDDKGELIKETQENGKVTIPLTDPAKFTQEVMELLNLEVEMPDLGFTIDSLDALEINFTYDEINALDAAVFKTLFDEEEASQADENKEEVPAKESKLAKKKKKSA